MRNKTIFTLILLCFLVVAFSQTAIAYKQASISCSVQRSPYSYNIDNGDNILVIVKVTVASTSDVIPGSHFKVYLDSPTGVPSSYEYTTSNQENLQPGSTYTYDLHTGIKADESGTWTVGVEFYDYSKSTKIATTTSSFKIAGGGNGGNEFLEWFLGLPVYFQGGIIGGIIVFVVLLIVVFKPRSTAYYPQYPQYPPRPPPPYY